MKAGLRTSVNWLLIAASILTMEYQNEERKRDDKLEKDGTKKSAMTGVESRNHGRLFALLLFMFFVFVLVGAVVVLSSVLCIFSQLDLRKRLAEELNNAKIRDTERIQVRYASYWWDEWSSWSPCRNTSCQFYFSTRDRVCNVSSEGDRIPRGRTCVGHHEETRLCPLLSYCLDCAEILHTEGRFRSTNGIYAVNPGGRGPPFQVYCDMTTDGGGWTVFQRRQVGSEDFNRTWNEYKTGFGNLSGEFWLGNDKIHRLTSFKRNRTLRVDMTQMKYYKAFAVYHEFRLSNEQHNYTLSVDRFFSGRRGTLGSNENGKGFSTIDRDNDLLDHANCASDLRGGWWYGYDCSWNLNGLYGYYFRWPRIPNLTYSDMKIK